MTKQMERAMTAERSTTSDVEVNLRVGDKLFEQFAPPSPETFPSVADSVYDQLWRRVVNREFQPGDRLVEDTLAQELGTSRTPVREALLRLGQTGLVHVSSRKGFSVPVTGAADVVELFDLRCAIETYAIRRATPLISDEAVALHRGAQRAALPPSDHRDTATAEAFYRADLSEVMGQLSWFCMRSAIMPDRNQMAIAEHQAILDALESRDPDAAAAAMEAHLQAVKERAIIDLEGGTR
jgi:DNA-binding GntR family transcriptional regulator